MVFLIGMHHTCLLRNAHTPLKYPQSEVRKYYFLGQPYYNRSCISIRYFCDEETVKELCWFLPYETSVNYIVSLSSTRLGGSMFVQWNLSNQYPQEYGLRDKQNTPHCPKHPVCVILFRSVRLDLWLYVRTVEPL